MQILEHINSREDLLAVPWEQEAQLCQEIRQWLVQNVAKTGVHRRYLAAVPDRAAFHHQPDK